LVLLSIGISWENNLKGSLSNEKKSWQHQRSSLGRIMEKGEREVCLGKTYQFLLNKNKKGIGM
jgi:hypothetical protein